MRLLIDGYNLIHAAGILGPRRSDGRGLERSRAALAQFISGLLRANEKSSAVVVFDAAGAPPGLPSEMFVHGVYVRFARGYSSADELIEELINADTSPRRLTVVSSDHRIQRAARRRRATAVDSDTWYDHVARRSHADDADDRLGAKPRRGGKSPPPPHLDGGDKPCPATLDEEVRFWLGRIVEDTETDPERPTAHEADDIFPPGYAEDMFDEEG
jgi:predicted RNA-binding protein with PIN domain